jgi:hypothetical protein
VRPLRAVVTAVVAVGLVVGAGTAPAHAAPATAQLAPAEPPPGWVPGVAEAAAFAATRAGAVSFSVRTPLQAWELFGDRQEPSASIVKAMLLTAYLRRPSVSARPLTRTETRLLRPMIRSSDNIAATRVRDRIGNAALEQLARDAGMIRFATDPIWGRARITAADQSRFFLALEGLLPPLHRATALRWLATIVPSQRWGVGRERPAGWRLYFKGGWGSGTGAVDHQVALLALGSWRVSIAVLTTGSPTHEYGNATLRGVFHRLLRGLATELVGEARPA